MKPINKHIRILTCLILLLAGHARAADTLIASNSVWSYLGIGGDQGTVWREPAFDDTGWPTGPGQLGFGDGDEATVLLNIPFPTFRTTFYFRHTFNVADPSIYANLTVRFLRDDGGIVYINGVEVFRSNMPLTNVNFNTFALVNQNASNEVTYFPRTVPASVLVAGANVVAVEVHQAAAGTDDLSFDLALLGNLPLPNQPPTANPQNVAVTQNTPRSITLTGSDPEGSPLTFSIVTSPTSGTLTGTPPNVVYVPAPGFLGTNSFTFKVNDGSLDSAPATVMLSVNPPPPPPSQLLIPTNSVWRYLDTGVDAGTVWRGLGYDDSAWASGPAQLGFGDGDEATVINSMPNGSPIITAYFRKFFVVSNANQVVSLPLRLFKDDGGVVYINGVEVFRSNMPGGNINYFTLASGPAPEDGNAPFPATVPSSMLVNGLNVVAVEVHQNAVTSSDMTFNFDLRANIGTVTNHPPVASSSSVSVDEDSSVAITLQASDPDGNLLFYSNTQPTHGTLSGTAPNLTYQPNADYNGPDSFSFTVNDGRGGSAGGTVSITVNPVNDAPVAVAKAAAADDPSNQTRNLVIVTANNTDADVIFDGTASSDVDGDALAYGWFLDGSLTPFSSAATVTQTLPVGNHTITLVVFDGVATAADTITVQIFTPCNVVENLAAQVEAANLAPNERNSLLGHLNAACATFSNGNTSAGVHQLELFQTRVNNKIAPNNPALAETLNAAAQEIINAVQ